MSHQPEDFFSSFGDGTSPPAAAAAGAAPPVPTARAKKAPPPPPPPGAKSSVPPARRTPASAAAARPAGSTAAPPAARRSAAATSTSSSSSNSRYRGPPTAASAAGTSSSTSIRSTGAASRQARPTPPIAAFGGGASSGGTSTSRQASTSGTSYYGNTQASSTMYQSQSAVMNAAEKKPLMSHDNLQQQQPSSSSQGSDSIEWFSSGTTSAAPAPTATTTNPYATSTFVPQQQQQQIQQQQQQLQPMNPYATSNTASLQGTMDQNKQQQQQAQQQQQPSFFMPTMDTVPSLTSPSTSFEDEPPLLEELGINIGHIVIKTKAVVVPSKRLAEKLEHLMSVCQRKAKGHPQQLSPQHAKAILDPALIVEDADLAGPLVLCLLLGAELLLMGKIQFGYIYGFSMFGCLAMTLILNLMAPQQAVSVWTVTSILGYALLPVNILAAGKIVCKVLPFGESLLKLWALGTIVWSTAASTRLLELGCGMSSQRYLMAYPIALLYCAFVLITIF